MCARLCVADNQLCLLYCRKGGGKRFGGREINQINDSMLGMSGIDRCVSNTHRDLFRARALAPFCVCIQLGEVIPREREINIMLSTFNSICSRYMHCLVYYKPIINEKS